LKPGGRFSATAGNRPGENCRGAPSYYRDAASAYNAGMRGRSRAREVALQVIYQDDLNPRVDPGAADRFLADRLREPELIEFARSLVSGVRRNRQEVDEVLSRTADNWSLRRMAATDRNILRMGAYEILFGGTPGPVAINEAVELAKRFGAKQSAHFVNGILDRFLEGHSKQPAPSAE
jgi:transcription antitermination protein NusB